MLVRIKMRIDLPHNIGAVPANSRCYFDVWLVLVILGEGISRLQRVALQPGRKYCTAAEGYKMKETQN